MSAHSTIKNNATCDPIRNVLSCGGQGWEFGKDEEISLLGLKNFLVAYVGELMLDVGCWLLARW